MSRTYRGDSTNGNYYFGYLSNPGGISRPSSANGTRSRTPTQTTRLTSNLSNGSSAANMFVDITNKLGSSNRAYISSNIARPTSAGLNRPSPTNPITSTDILYQALHPSTTTNQQANSAVNVSSAANSLPSAVTNPTLVGVSGTTMDLNSFQYRQSYSRPKSAGPCRRPQGADNYVYQQQYYQQYYQEQQLQHDETTKIPSLTTKYVAPTVTGPAITAIKPSPNLITINNTNTNSNSSAVPNQSANSKAITIPSVPTLVNSHSGDSPKTNSNVARPIYNYPNTTNVTIAQPGQQSNAITSVANTMADKMVSDNKPTAGLQPLANYTQVRPSSATSRVRQAINDSHKIGLSNITPISNIPTNVTPFSAHQNNLAPTATNGGSDVQGGDDEGDLTGDLNGNKHTTDDDEDNEMDGKPFSRSHPEVSLTTPSHSLELGGQGTLIMNTVDVRNSSVDSLQDEDIDVGLSTLPNQFCTKRDAVELKKLIMMGNNDHGGIIPSSSALMDIYMVGKVIGVGSYGKVRVAWHRLTGAKVAIKTYDKSKMKDQAHWKRVYSEIKIMEQVSHPRISRLYEAVETPKRMHLIMECLDGGNLCSYVKQKKRLSEDESRRIFFQIIQAVDYLHSYGITHRDIKLENVLFTGNNAAIGEIKLIDFGFSTVCQPGKRLKVFCGTPSYMAPEIVRRLEYEGKAVDMWSLGILLYALLCGCFPFRAKTYPDLYRRIARGTFAIPDELSTSVKDLLRNLLSVDASERLTAHASLRHVWLQMQFSTAQDLNRLKRDTPILISDKPSDDIDEQVVSEMEKYGIPREETIRVILTKTHTAIATLYYLLLDNIITKRKITGSAYAQGAMSKNVRGNVPMNKPIKQNVINTNTMNAPSNPNSQPYKPADITLAAQYVNFQNYNQPQAIMLGSGQGVGLSAVGSQRPRSASAARTSTGQKPLISFLGQR